MSNPIAVRLRKIATQFGEAITAGDGIPVRDHLNTAASEIDGFELECASWKHANDLKAARIAELEAALRKLDRLNDHPGRFNREINDAIRSVLDQPQEPTR